MDQRQTVRCEYGSTSSTTTVSPIISSTVSITKSSKEQLRGLRLSQICNTWVFLIGFPLESLKRQYNGWLLHNWPSVSWPNHLLVMCFTTLFLKQNGQWFLLDWVFESFVYKNGVHRTTVRSVQLSSNIRCRKTQGNALKCREMKICRDIFVIFMTHGNVIFDILEPPAFIRYSTCWVLQKFEEPWRILKKFVHACVVNTIHAKLLPCSVIHWTLNQSKSD